MKRRIAFLLALIMCCSLILTALPAAKAMVMDFVRDKPGQTAPERKVSFSILEQMAAAEDEEPITVCVHLRRLSREEIEALVPMTKPSNYVNESTQEERDAWSHLEYQTRQRIYSGMSRAFIQRYLDETEAPESLPIQETPHFNCALNKSRIAALAALDEVIWINDAWMNIYLVQEPAPQEKLTGNLLEYLRSAQEDERIPVRLWLRGWRTEEYEALNPLPYPTFASTPEELAAYRSASAQASQTVYSDPYGTFVRTRLDESDEVLYQPQMAGVPLVIVKTTPAKIAALAKLRIVSQVDPAFGYDVAFPDPELPTEPDQLKKIDQRLREFMRISTHDELIPVSINLKTPATIDSNSTREEKRAAYSGLTTAFVENRLDETDEVLVRSNYSNFVMAIIPKHKIATLAALDDVTNINWVPEYNDPAYPADGGDAVFTTTEESALSDKIAWPLQVKMTGTADDTRIRVSITLDAPSLRDVDAQMTGKQFSTVDELYAYRETLRQQYMSEASSIYGTFTANYLDEASEQVYQQPDYAYVVATLPKTRIAALAMLDEVTRIEQWHEQDPMELVLPPEEPGVQAKPEKIESDLQREMDGAADDEVIRILLWLNAPSNKEIDATVPPPEDSADPEQVEAYISAAYRARTATKHGIVEAFVQNHMSKTNELLAAGELGPYLLAATTKSRILSLTALDEVQRIERYGIPAFAGDEDPPQVPTGEPAQPSDPAVLKKLSSDLVTYMEGKADDAMIPIGIDLVGLSREEKEAILPPEPDIYSDLTLEEVNAYIHEKRTILREVYSSITSAFADDYLDENDTIRYLSKYTAHVICNVPKSKVYSLAALEEVTQIVYAPQATLYPTWIRDESEIANKLTAELKDYMETAPDDEPVAIRVDLHMPSEEIMERIVSVPKPGEDASQEEIDAYNAAYQETWRYQVSLRTDSFVNHTLSGSEPVPVYYIGQDNATVICEVAGWRVKYLASMQEITQIDLAGNDEPAPCEHDYQAVVTAPTCTEGGYTTYTCSKCGDSYRGDETEALGHDWDEGVVTKQPTEMSTGVRTYTCSRCAEKRIEMIPMLSHVHSYTATVTPPTCTEAGFTTHACACGDNYVDSMVPALGHSFGAWTTSKAATCTADGEQTRTCALCDAKETREIAALDHDYKAVVTAPTCTAAGFTTHTCIRCGETYTDAETDALGHDWDEGEVTKEPTEAEEGVKTITCTRCGVKRTESIPVKEHVHAYTDIVTAPTCTEAGFTTHTCACGDSYVDSEVSALGHDFQDSVCTRCGAEDPDYVPPVVDPFRFDDVKDSALYYYEPVYWAVEQGITKGTGEKRFSPGDDCTRAQVVTFLWRAAGEPEPAGSKNPFRDVKEDAYYCKAVLWAVEQEITKGTSANTFSPDDTCTRAQIVTFLYRANGSPALSEETNPFRDVPAGQYYTDPVLWAVQTGVTKGKSPETFAPTATCTRAEVVTFLYRAKTGK